MKILYLSDDRSEYRQGYYYVDWINVFKKHHHLILAGADFPPVDREQVRDVELVIIGHGAQDALLSRSHTHRRIRQTWHNLIGNWTSLFRELKCPKIILSKNDYKAFDKKIEQVKFDKVDLLITHSKESLPHFRAGNIPAEWVPFGVDRSFFQNDEQKRDIDIGFRGNLHDAWNGGIRSRLVKATQKECADLKLDIKSGQSGEHFLFGEKYVQWINRCRLVLNTVSAIGTVGPKWWEEMACGAIPLAPIEAYEGLLEPDVHYLAVNPDMSNLREKIDRFNQDADFRQRIITGTQEMVQQADMEQQYQWLWRILQEHKLVS